MVKRLIRKKLLSKNGVIQHRLVLPSTIKTRYLYDRSRRAYIKKGVEPKHFKAIETREPAKPKLPVRTNIRYFFGKQGETFRSPQTIGAFGNTFDIVISNSVAKNGFHSLYRMVHLSSFNYFPMQKFVRAYEQDDSSNEYKYTGELHYIVYEAKVAESEKSEQPYTGRYIADRYNVRLTWPKDKQEIIKLVNLP